MQPPTRAVPTQIDTSATEQLPATILMYPPAPAIWAPLETLYEEEMARRRECRFQVEDLADWIAGIVRLRRGVYLEDPLAVADWLEDHYPDQGN